MQESTNSHNDAYNHGGVGGGETGEGQEQLLPKDTEHHTLHKLLIDGMELSYRATVGTITIEASIGLGNTEPAASLFYTAFMALDESGHSDVRRPLTFIFNGGPGSSTTFLLMGSVGPKRIDLPDAAPIPGAPYQLSDNQHSLLPSSDLVFIDAAGAGFSQILDKAKKELWSVDGDVKGFSSFIRAFLSKYHRWNSPKYVLGESYGTTRGAALAYRLQQDAVAVNGIVLISNILDYSYTFDSSDQMYLGYFPTLAAVAQYHGKAGVHMGMAEHVNEARAFADGPLRLALARGDSLDRQSKRDIAERFADLTGLTAQYVFDSNLRVLDARFRKELLRDQDRIVGRYDGRSSGYDLDRVNDTETFVVDDAYLGPAYASLANDYLRDRLGWPGQAERKEFAGFDWQSTEPGKGWVWWHRLPEDNKNSENEVIPFPSVIADLAAAISHQPTMKVLICNGMFDLCTPFGQTEYDIDHLALPEPLRANVALSYYPAGHMLYTSAASLEKFSRDLVRFIATDAGHMAQMDERPRRPFLADLH